MVSLAHLAVAGGVQQRKYDQMTGITPIKDLRGYLEPEEVDRLMEVASNCRDKLLGLIESTDKREAAIYNFLQQRQFYQLTTKGKAEERAWEDPIAAIHPEVR